MSAGPTSPAWPALLAAALFAAAVETPAESGAIAWDERLEIAAGDAFQGPWRMNESEFLYVDDPTAALNDAGVLGIAWVDNARQDIFFQAIEPDGGRRLASPVNVSRSPDIFSWLPRLVIGSGDADAIYVLWQEIVFSGGSHGGEIFFARSTDGGRTFSEPINLSNTLAGAGKGRLDTHRWHNGSLDLAVGGNGHLYAAWTEYEGRLWLSRSSDGGESFTTPIRIAGDDKRPARGPSLAVGGGESIHLAWTVGEDRRADIHIARSNDGGRTFSEPRPVHESGGHADAPKLAVDGNGTVHLVYGESPTGPWQRYHIRYTRSEDGGGRFATPREISGPHGEAFDSVNFPHLAVDGDDNLYVLWELFPGRMGRPQGLGFTWSNDGGRTFAEPVPVPGSIDPTLGINGSLQGLLMNKLAVNTAGDIAVVNSTFKPNESSHIWLYRARKKGPE